MKSELLPLTAIFERRALRVPSYQRGYAWEALHREDLLQDLEDLAQLPDGKHYTGTIVVRPIGTRPVGSDEVSLLEIVDGQQRLTTLVILLSCICDRLRELAEETADADTRKIIKDEAHDLRRRFISDRSLAKLELSGDGDTFFRNHVIGSQAMPSPSSRAAKNLSDAKGQLRRYVRREGEHANRFRSSYDEYEDLQALLARVKQRLTFVYFEVDSDADVGMMFEAMNARGKALTQFEKVKNYLIYVATKFLEAGFVQESLVWSVNDAWTEVFRRLEAAGDKASEDAFLRSHWVTFPPAAHPDGIAKTSDIHAALKLTVRGERGAEKTPEEKVALVNDYLSQLRPAVRAYSSLMKPTHPDAFKNIADARDWVVDMASRFRRLDRMASTMPLLMASVVKFSDTSPQTIREVMRLAEVFAFRMNLLERRSNAGLERVYRLANEVGGGMPAEPLIREMKALISDYAPDKEVHASLLASDGTVADGNFYEWDGLLYFLFEYERHRVEERHQTLSIDYDKLCAKKLEDSIEHILPQGEKTLLIDYWAQRFTDEEFKRNRHRLGNLTLTQWNSSLQAKPFPEKCGTDLRNPDARAYRNSTYACEAELVAYSNWGPAEIDDRQKKLADFAIRRWAI